ncbi:MAG: NPCBM/NEW2 domain-containing protein [Candidatus Poribacteria bacterium]|nr:NPCBM/NEW2 domain-containing protein [Candidatus Poribacteria bacterium]
MKITSIILISAFLLCGFTLAAVAADRMVKVIYFVPNDRTFQWDILPALDTQMKKVQTFFADQMEVHGYGRKTFKLETDANGQVVVHPLTGQHGDAHYHTDTLNKIYEETKAQFDTDTHIYLFVVDVSTEKIEGNCGVARFEGGPAMVPASGDCVADERGVQLIAHELGHAFNLIHDFRNDLYIMSYGSERREFSVCAAVALNVSPFFNESGNAANTSATIDMLTPWTYPANAEGWTVRFKVSDPDGIYQVQFEQSVADEGSSISDCKTFDNIQDATVEFMLPTDATAAEINNIWIRVFDQNANVTTKEWTLEATDAIDTTETFTYLTLSYNSPDSLVPTNTRAQWDGWLGHIWEKTPDGQVAEKPQFHITHPYVNVWGHWFYAHAESRIVYDISDKNYTRFECLFYLANPCAHAPPVASMEVICLADGTEIYNSGVLSGMAEKEKNRHQISFNIPTGTQILTIRITDGPNDSRCDHFVLGNLRIFYTETPETETETETEIETETETETIDVDIDRTETYLTLTSKSADALVPTNPQTEWAGWNSGVWEKTPEGTLPPRPNGFISLEGFSSFYDNWDYFFYSHAASRFVYDLSNGNYATFEAYFDMPNPCPNSGSVEIICLADGVVVYNSGILIATQTRNIPISFDIPENTQTLTIYVTDAFNGDGCDHFIFANAKLLHRETAGTDVNNDGVVNIIDLVLVAVRYGEKIVGNPFPNPDVNRDGIVDINDIILVTQDMPPVSGAPSLVATHRSILTSTDWREAYAALPDTVVDRGIAVLDLLFGAVVPTKTLLLENFPNPFNPETWIPYQLATPADVVIMIHAIDGQVVRKLDLGHQEAGRYVNRSRAAYWDGKNALGESVASGLYFYTFTAGKFVATRRMLIRK